MSIFYIVLGVVIGFFISLMLACLIVSIMLKKSNEIGNSKAEFYDFAGTPLHVYNKDASIWGVSMKKNPYEASFTGRVGNHGVGDGLNLLKNQYFK